MKIATELMQTNHATDKVSISLILPHTCMLFLVISSLRIIPQTSLRKLLATNFNEIQT